MKMMHLAISLVFGFAGPTLAQQAGMTQSELGSLDADGDGAVSKSEFDAFSNFAFETMDKDSSRALSPDEVDDYLIGDAFKMLDEDGDGSVSASEYMKQMDGDFAASDKDGNGSLD